MSESDSEHINQLAYAQTTLEGLDLETEHMGGMGTTGDAPVRVEKGAERCCSLTRMECPEDGSRVILQWLGKTRSRPPTNNRPKTFCRRPDQLNF